MGFIFRKRFTVRRGTSVNVSKRGASVSQKMGRRVTINSRGGGSVRILPGLSFRFGKR